MRKRDGDDGDENDGKWQQSCLCGSVMVMMVIIMREVAAELPMWKRDGDDGDNNEGSGSRVAYVEA